MTSISRTRRAAHAAAWITAGAVGTTVVTGLAFAAPSAPGRTVVTAAANPAADRSASADGKPGRAVLHGELTVQGAGGPTVVAVQRGKVTAASASSLTVRSSDGFTATYAVSSTTSVRRDRKTATADALVVGDAALVRAVGTAAQSVRALSASALEKLTGRVGQGTGRGSGQSRPLDGAGA